jgi:hypothetical protein
MEEESSNFCSRFPATYERLKRSFGRRANAVELICQTRLNEVDVIDPGYLWRNLLLLIQESDCIDRGVVNANGQAAIQKADEFGIDLVHTIHRGSDGPQIRVAELLRDRTNRFAVPIQSESLTSCDEVIMRPTQLWTVPFQNAVIVELQNTYDGQREIVLLPTHKSAIYDLSFWAVNHNNLTEDPADFNVPPFLHGDATLVSTLVFASSEGRGDIAGAKIAATSIVIRNRDVLMFDQAKLGACQHPPKHWRQLLTDELWEPRSVSVVSSCFVLDEMMLFASNDGILRAHPRVNPRSIYHVEDLQSLVPQMTSLYNVVALVLDHDQLEVRLVERTIIDPFIRFSGVLYQARLVDASHAPLLYGPYVIYASLDGCWYRVLYDTPLPKKAKEIVKIPYKAGWRLIAVKNANWRFWTVVLQNPQTQVLEDHFVFAGGGTCSTKPGPFLNTQIK